MHSTLWIKGTKSKSLEGKTVVLAVTGSIAAVRVVELARELIRNGANVYAVMSEAATRILHPDALHYATGHEVITDITGGVEHVGMCGLQGMADLLLIAPATANTISKIAMGIDDTPVTTFATTAIGSGVATIVVPAMHQSMYDHPAVNSNLEKLGSYGISLVGPRVEEGIAKIAPNDDIVLAVERELMGKKLAGKKIVLTSGATAEAIDPIRIITNRASGKTGQELAREAFRRGGDVTIIHRNELDADGINEVYAESAASMLDSCMEEIGRGCDVFISSAAISDYTLDSLGSKIKSGQKLILEMHPTEKILPQVRSNYPAIVTVGFKAETGVGEKELVGSATRMLEEYGLDMVVANDVMAGGMGTSENSIYILQDESSASHYSGSKRYLASIIMDRVEQILL
ncbi:bifunctional phosphopantothenoylcysteine decarboxylase/phosphopantothenate--cysteine ligase CoaBC [Methanohalophilus mahii]|uniref:Coenzyme A biosynthesis bifunctional protein CoaBC n=1 Tax=Methanohalophilus mahii (strain ATCC 35705 / DSM 5219 / SLP) TaxID=547558 RepID=D5EA41_METMS|nr:bifunctional phosphopantothenoylcysteine decarboxylase/phosphopantothenate--cysteine ligase CoaBC [Methanohalophilus mahii]ADE36042.1 Phosphopantothenoylcysteine decarboxylase; Phosphopantothenate-cysteine ligase [Methanohalophilus mahii DSM 5219]